MHACRFKFNRHDCWFGATVKDIVNGRMQLLQTWLMVRCKCNIHRCRLDETVTDMYVDCMHIIKT